MKNFIFLLVITTLTGFQSFGQTEKDQKLAIKTQTTGSSSRNTQNTTPFTTNELFQKQEIRQESQRPKPTTIYPTPFGYNSWNRWGAPYYYNTYYDFYNYDRWGYSRPGRIYVKSDGNRDTIINGKKKVRLGINVSTRNELGGWFTIGNSVYFKAEVNKITSNDKSQYYNNPNVNFYNATTSWNDKRLEDITKGWSAYLGVGREFKNFGVNLSLGFGKEIKNYQFFDELFVLSNNGNYSFENYIDNYVTFNIGLTHDYKFLSINTNVDPIRKTIYLGAGFNF